MSQYVVLIEAQLDCIGTINPHAISIATNPERALEIMQNYCPVPLKLIHAIHTANRTEHLEKTLRIRYHSKRLHGFWFNLATEEIAFLKSITPQNLINMPGLLKKMPPPDTTRSDLEALIKKNLAIASDLLDT